MPSALRSWWEKMVRKAWSRRWPESRRLLQLEYLEDRTLLSSPPPAPMFGVGTTPSAVAVADLGNGQQDIVVANKSDNTVSVLLGDGTGQFSPDPFSSPGLAPGTFAVGSSPSSVVVADLGNGHQDIIVTNAGDDTVSVLVGNGDGSFQPQQTFDAGPAPTSVAVADLDGDGRPDLVVGGSVYHPSFFGGYSTGAVSVLVGNGDGSFQAPQTLPLANPALSVAVADLNGDGAPDLVVGSSVYHPSFFGPGYSTGAVTVLLGNGDSSFQKPQTLPLASSALSVTVADLDGDGRPDLVVGGSVYHQSFFFGYSTGAVSVLLGKGDGSFLKPQTISLANPALSVAVADLNGDGQPDLVTADGAYQGLFGSYPGQTVSVLLGQGDGSFQNPQSFPVGQDPVAVAVADVNGDGQPDLVAANYASNSVSVLLLSPVTHFDLAAPSTPTAGASLALTVSARDAQDRVVPDFTGTVHFSSSDPTASLPPDYTFTAADGGVHTFTDLSLTQAGTQSLTASLTSSTQYVLRSTGQTKLAVQPAAVDHLSLALPTVVTSNQPFSITLTAQDRFNNTVTGYLGTVRFSNSDRTAALPTDYTFTPTDQGVHTFSGVMFPDGGLQTVAITDKANPALAVTPSLQVSGATLATAAVLSLPPQQPTTISGFLSAADQVALYQVQLDAGDQLSAGISALSAGSGLQSLLRVFDATGQQVALDDQEGGDPQLTFQAATAGTYYVGVSSAGNDNYNPTVAGRGHTGSTTGLYTLNLRLQPGAPLKSDLAGSLFRLGTDTAVWGGEAVPVSFTVENRGGADAGAFDVRVLLSKDNRFDPSTSVVLQAHTTTGQPLSFSEMGLAAGGAFSSGDFTVTLPDQASLPVDFPSSGPVYLGLEVVPMGSTGGNELDPLSLHRGSSWEPLTIVTPVPAGGKNLSQTDPSLNTQAAGHLGSSGPPDTYTFTVTPTQGSGQFTAQVTTTGGLAPRLTLEGPLDVGSGSGGSVGLLTSQGYAGLHFDGQGFVPPDSQGAAGPASYLETVNQTIALFDKAAPGDLLTSDSFGHFWSLGNLDPVDSQGVYTDPSVTYDDNIPGQPAASGRFIVTDVNGDDSTGAAVLDIAVSRSADPKTLTAADWYFYQITTTEKKDPISDFISDYPGNLGFNQDALIVTVNQLDPSGSGSHTQVNAINIQDLVNGVPADQLRFSQSDLNILSVRPATEHDAQSGDPEWLVSETGDGQHINVYKMTDVLSAAPPFSLTQLAVHPYTDISLVPPLQPDGSTVTTQIDSRIQKAAEAKGMLVATQAVGLSATQDAAQWYVIDVSSGTPKLQQQGDVSLGDNTYAYYPAIDISPSGVVGMTFMDSGTAAGQFPSMYVTGRLPTDPAGQMATPVLVPAGAGQKNYHDFGGGRAGDLSGINIDPKDGSFWAVNEFANQDPSGANWATAIAHFGVKPGSGGATISLLNDKGYPGLHFTLDGFVPPDSQGAAGPASYVETVNQTIALFEKASGAIQTSDSFNDFWSLGGLAPVDSRASYTDPVVTYDDNVPGQTAATGRFIVADVNGDDSTGASVLDIAVSRSADPKTLTAADWYFYQISTSEVGFSADYPGNLGFNQDALVITLNQFAPGGSGDGDSSGSGGHTQVNAISIQDLVSGVAPDQLRFSQSDINNDESLRPATEHDAQSGDPEWLVSETGDGQHINVYKMTDVLSAAPPFSLTQLAVHPYTDISLVPPLQPDGSTVTTQIDSRIQKAAEAKGMLVATQAVGLSATQDAAQWYVIDVSSGTPKPKLLQQGDVSLGDNTYAYYPAIDISPSGVVGMTFMDSGTAAGQFPSMYVTGRLPTDPAGQMATPVLVPAGAGLKNLASGNRAGDLSGINIDPLNGSFWAVNEFANQDASGANWATAIANFDITSPPPSTSGPSSPHRPVLIQSDDGSLVQHLQPGTYTLTVSARSGTGSYQLVSHFVQANPPLDPAGVGPNPKALAVADLNRDGIPDVIATTSNGTVSVLLGNGDGSFQPGRPLDAGPDPRSVVVADVNGDGKPDLVVGNSVYHPPYYGQQRYFTGAVTILLGNGDGTFQKPQTLPLDSPVLSLAVADVNGDGKPDLVVGTAPVYHPGFFGLLPAYYTSGGVDVLLGKGDGTFQAPRTFDYGASVRALAVADLNGDGKPDIVTTNYYDNTVSVLLGDGGGNFRPDPFSSPGLAPSTFNVGSNPGAVVVADVNGDGQPDLLVANGQGNNAQHSGLSVLLGNGDGSFQPQKQFNTGFVPFSMTVGDLNGDGSPDVVVGNFGQHTESVLLGKGDGTFEDPRSFATGFYPGAVVVADVNGDGKPDVLVANSGSKYNPGQSVGVLLGNGDGTLQAPPTISAGAVPNAVVVADVNGDGHPDLLSANAQDNTVSVLLGNGDGSFQSQHTFATGYSPQALAVADLNGDGRPDLVVANQGQYDPSTRTLVGTSVGVLLGNGDGTFQPQQTFAVGVGPRSVAVADVNGDGIPDLIVTNYFSSSVSILLGNGDGSFRPQQTFPIFFPSAVAVADVNGDLVVTSADNTGSVLLNRTPKGATTVSFKLSQTFAAGDHPTDVVVAEVDGDKRPDLIIGHYSGDQNVVSVLLGTGDGTFGPPRDFTAGPDPSSVAVADVNGDGKPDLITANFRGNSISVLLGDGHGSFGPQQTFAAGFTPASVNVADVNSDGKPDIVVGNTFAGSFTVLLGNNGGTFTQATPGSESGQRNTPYLADLTGDGILDSVVLDRAGHIVFRPGTPGNPDQFGPAVILNDPKTLGTDRPARDLTVIHTPSGWAIAAADASPDPKLSKQAGHPVYTVSLYTYNRATGKFTQMTAFTTDRLPTRIAAADLTDPVGTANGLDDIVLANSLDNSIQVAFQQADGTFSTPMTLLTDEAPSDLALVPVQNPKGLPDIVVTNQASGDVNVFRNDFLKNPKQPFSTTNSYTFRAGTDPYGLDPSGSAISSREQSVSLAAGNFLSNGRNDLVVVNRGTDSFSVLPADGNGGFLNPQSALTTSTDDRAEAKDQPGAVVAGDFNRDGKDDLAILMEGRAEVWIYLGDGKGHFTHAFSIAAGEDPTGLTLVPGTGKGPYDLLVGNEFGDVLRLVGQADGSFQPATGDSVAVAAASDLLGQNRPGALVSNQSKGHATLQAPTANEQQFNPVETVTAQAPVSGQPVKLDKGSSFNDLMVADSGGNNVLVYRGTGFDASGNPTYAPPASYSVGQDPVAVTVADLNGDKIPDMVVANQGSNDVSLYFGHYDANGNWFATPGPRLSSGGQGPVSTMLEDLTGPNGQPDGIQDLVITNQDGTVAVLPGVGQGFFRDVFGSRSSGDAYFLTIPTSNGPNVPVPLPVPLPPSAPLVPTSTTVFSLSTNGTTLTPVFTAPANQVIAAVGVDPKTGDLAVAFQGGVVQMLQLNPATGLYDSPVSLIPLDALPPDPSTLTVLDISSNTTEVLVTSAGSDQLFVFGESQAASPISPETPTEEEQPTQLAGPGGPGQTGPGGEFSGSPSSQEPIPSLPEGPSPSTPGATVSAPNGAPLVLVVTLGPGELPEGETGPTSETESANLGVADRSPSESPAAAVEVGGDDQGLASGDDIIVLDDVGPGTDDGLRNPDLFPDREDELGPALSQAEDQLRLYRLLVDTALDDFPPEMALAQTRDEWDLALAELWAAADEGLPPAENVLVTPAAGPASVLPRPDGLPPAAAASPQPLLGNLVRQDGIQWQPDSVPAPVQVPPAATPEAALDRVEGMRLVDTEPFMHVVPLPVQTWDWHRVLFSALALAGAGAAVETARREAAPDDEDDWI